MKKTIIILVLATISFSVMAFRKDSAYLKARRSGAETQIKVCVVDDEGKVVPNANIKVFMGMNFRPKGYWINGKTDKDGLFIVEGETCGDEIEMFLTKDGFYNSSRKLCFVKSGFERSVRDGRWIPYGFVEKIQLRKIRNPVALYSLGFGSGKEVLATNTWIGVDMVRGDFIRPYGNGENADFEVMVEWDGRPPIYSNHCTANIRFIGPLSGCYCATMIRESEYPYVYRANENDDYDLRQVKVVSRGRFCQSEKKSLGTKEILVTRTRCVLDEKGKLKSACYGYVRFFDADAGWEGKPTMRLSYVFNPTPNDTNLEPKR